MSFAVFCNPLCDIVFISLISVDYPIVLVAENVFKSIINQLKHLRQVFWAMSFVLDGLVDEQRNE